jgi:glycosyltransferase involved in cell wall biosynthesis
MSEKKRIFVYRDTIDGGGSGKILKDLLFYFDSIGYEVFVIARVCSDNLWYRELNGDTINPRLFVLGDTRYWAFRTMDNIRAMFSDTEVNPLITFADQPLNPYLVNLCRILEDKKVFLVYMETNHPSLFTCWYDEQVRNPTITQKLVHDSVDYIRLENKNFDKYVDDENKKKVFSFYNLCRIPKTINKIDLKRRFNIITTHGLREPRKSILPFFDVMRKVRETGLDIGLYVCGVMTPQLKEAADVYIKGHQLEDYITITDSLPNIHDYYASVDMYVSTAVWEGTSNAVLEAFAHGLPVVCLETSLGVNETVEDGVTGYVCKDTDMMFDKVYGCYKDAKLHTKLSENAKEFSLQYVNEDTSVKKWKDILDKVENGYVQSADIVTSRNELIKKMPKVVTYVWPRPRPPK